MASAEFDKLFEFVVTALERRKGDAAGAELLSDRGFKNSKATAPMRRSRSWAGRWSASSSENTGMT